MSPWTTLRRAGADTSATSQPVPAAPPDAAVGGLQAASADPHDYMPPSARLTRRLLIGGIIVFFLLVPLATTAASQPTVRNLAGLGTALVFVPVVIMVAVVPGPPSAAVEAPSPYLAAIVALAIATLAITGDSNWVTGLAVAAAACGRFCRTVRPAAFGAVSCALGGLVIGLADHASQGNLAAIVLVPPLGAFFAYSAGKRNEAVTILRAAQAELARVAVAEERLRIARDLHDLLGHSLSLITLKAELTRRLIDSDTARARAEIGDLEHVARQSLSDVREAVAGYRQPDLVAELAGARELLSAAGIACQVTAPPVILLPGDVDSVLAWTIREGVTNVVRHSSATSVVITVAVRATATVIEVTNNGVDSGTGPAPAGPGRCGSGLAGLGERVQALGGSLAAGPGGTGEFRLRVSIPAGGQHGRPDAELTRG
ncbi:MAG TPA: sensor histidine kinase [Streptosporangiaceae bacterium]|nr:sensor histidine kinase [Streptosporangiaceae bacterium]